MLHPVAKPAPAIDAIERRLAQLCERRHAILLGHGTTAIYLALSVIKRSAGPGEVILSPLVCSTVPQAIVYAGMTPVFADVCLPDCTIDPDSVAKLLNDKTRAILPVHLFGNGADMNRLTVLSASTRVPVIENAAQSIGGRSQGFAHGARGDIAILSFGDGKVLSAGGGGALLTDDSETAAWVREGASGMPPFTDDESYRLRTLSHRNLNHACIDMLRVEPNASVAASFINFVPFYRDLYFHSFPRDATLLQRIDRGLDDLNADLERRCRRAARYDDIFKPYASEISPVSQADASGVVWRYTVLLNEPAVLLALTDALRRAGIHASNHYWSMAQLMLNRRDLPRADHASPRLLNLWVDAVADDRYIDRTRDVIASVLQ